MNEVPSETRTHSCRFVSQACKPLHHQRCPAEGDKKIHTFLKSICPKMNVIAWLKFELVYLEAKVKHVNHYVTGDSPDVNRVKVISIR